MVTESEFEVKSFEVIKGLTISVKDRIAVFGRTGSGKTHLAIYWLLPHYDNYIFWDVKSENTGEVVHDIITTTPEKLDEDLKNYKKILYQPKRPTDNDFDTICEKIFKHGNTTLYVDEASAITTPSKITYWHKMIVTQGRSKNVGIINASQRPRDVFNTLISESEHLFVFSLSLETDIQKVRQQIADAADEIRFLQEWHFLYYSVRTNKSFIFKPIKYTTKYTEDIPPKKIIVPGKLELYQPKLEDYISIVQY